MRTGDTVRHVPSGEAWIVAWANEIELIPCGWPETFANTRDCVLLKACTDEEHWKLVLQIAKPSYGAASSSRAARCWQLLEDRRQAECSTMQRL